MRCLALILLLFAAAPAEAGRGARPPGGDMRSEAKVAVGDPLPAIELVGPDGAVTKLSDRHTGRPLVLIFGSFT